MNFHAALLVALGGALGSVLRYAISVALDGARPWGTLAVNGLGSVAIGVLAGAGVAGDARLLLATGFLGGFTTFSAFSLEAMTLLDEQMWRGIAYVAASLAAGFAGFALGVAATRSV